MLVLTFIQMITSKRRPAGYFLSIWLIKLSTIFLMSDLFRLLFIIVLYHSKYYWYLDIQKWNEFIHSKTFFDAFANRPLQFKTFFGNSGFAVALINWYILFPTVNSCVCVKISIFITHPRLIQRCVCRKLTRKGNSILIITYHLT